MAKVSFTNLKLKINKEVKEITFNDTKIEVLQYLPIEDKYDLVMITLQKAREGNIYNPVKLEMYFNLNLVYLYSNLSFTDKQREDEAKLYDTLMSNGLLNQIIEAIPNGEYNELMEYVGTLETKLENNEKSIAAKLADFMEGLPEKMQKAAEIAENFNPEQFKNVINFATAANGGRPIDFSKETEINE